jgi:hypothetical protein
MSAEIHKLPLSQMVRPKYFNGFGAMGRLCELQRAPAAKEHDSRPEAARPGRTSCNPNGDRPRSWRGRTRGPTVGYVACQGAQLSDGRGSFLSQRTGSPKRYYQIRVPVVICRCICRNFAGTTFGHLDAGPGRSRAPAFFFAGALSFG